MFARQVKHDGFNDLFTIKLLCIHSNQNPSTIALKSCFLSYLTLDVKAKKIHEQDTTLWDGAKDFFFLKYKASNKNDIEGYLIFLPRHQIS